MNDHPLDLLLAIEDLSSEERARVDGHLAGCDACRLLLERLQRVEHLLEPSGALPEQAWLDAQALPSDQRAKAEASLALLRERLRLDVPPELEQPVAPPAARIRRGVVPVPDWRRLLRWTPAIAAAAAAAWIVIVRVSPPEMPAPRGLTVAPLESRRGSESAWRTGDSFVLEFELESPAAVAVFVLDAAGDVALLSPATPDTRLARLPAGRHRLPDAASGREWRLTEPSGRDRLFVVTLRPRHASLREVLRELGTRATTEPYEARALRVREQLTRRLGAVSEVVVEHAP